MSSKGSRSVKIAQAASSAVQVVPEAHGSSKGSRRTKNAQAATSGAHGVRARTTRVE